MKTFIYLVLVMVSALLCNGCERQAPIVASGKTVKIGFIGPYSGLGEAKGKESVKGVRTVMHLYPLLKNGDAVELIVENDGSEPELAVKAVKKLVEEDQVAAILIASGSRTVLQVAAVADQYETPILALLATHPEVTSQSEYVNQLCFDDTFQGTVAALFAMDELLVDRMAVFMDPESTYSSYLSSVFIEKIRSNGGEVTRIVSTDKSGNGYAAILEDLRDKYTELLYLPVADKDLIEIERTLDKMDWSPEVMVSDGTLASVVTRYPGDVGSLDGIYATDFFSSYKHLRLIPRNSEKISRTYASLFSGKASTYTALGAEGYGILHRAMNRCQNSSDRKCINRMIRSTKDFTGLMAKITINQDGKAIRPLYINSIEDGRMKAVVKVY